MVLILSSVDKNFLVAGKTKKVDVFSGLITVAKEDAITALESRRPSFFVYLEPFSKPEAPLYVVPEKMKTKNNAELVVFPKEADNQVNLLTNMQDNI